MSEIEKDDIEAEENEDMEENVNETSDNDDENHEEGNEEENEENEEENEENEEDEEDVAEEENQENDSQDAKQDDEQNQHNPNGIYIRLRGLPWGVTNKDIADFLKDVKIAGGEKGIYIVKNKSDGKSTGEAFVELESENDEEEAFKHDKENMAHRYIEIFKATPEEAMFAMKKTKRSGRVLKLRGLPFSADEDMIEEFFDGLNIRKDREGIVIITDRKGRATGEAYVQFKTELDTLKALERNRDKIGHRYIELFRSGLGDLKRALGIRPAPYDRSGGRNASGRSFSNNRRNGNSLQGRNIAVWGNRPGGSFRNQSQSNTGRSSNFDSDHFRGGGRGFGSGRNSLRGSSFGNNMSGNGNGFGGGMYCIHMRGLPYNSYENDVNDMGGETRFIRLRGLPWSVTNQEILDFLEGVNVVDGEDGIYMVTSRFDGKNTGEAFVQLESEQDEEEAFKHNKENLGHRYIEIFSASNEEAEFAMRKPAQSNVVKLRGLPYSVDEATIEEFFDGLTIRPDREGIVIVMDRRGRASGEAYVQFETKEDTENALKLNREKIGHRYIEIFRSSIGEMKRSSNSSRSNPYDKNARGSGGRGNNSNFGGRSTNGRSNRSRGDSFGNDFGGRGGGGNFNNGGGGGFNGGGFNGGGSNFNNGGFGGGGGGRSNNSGGFGNFNNRNNFSDNDDDNFGSNFSSNRNNMGGGGNFGGRSNFSGNNFGSGGGRRGNDGQFVVHLRGLPYYCYENDVREFFAPLRPASVKIIYNNEGLHSGSADAYFENEDDAEEAMKRDRDQMGSRYIELFFDGNKKGNRRI